jgi:hypothetical protein
MNGDEWTSVDGHLWTNVRWNEDGHWTEQGRMLDRMGADVEWNGNKRQTSDRSTMDVRRNRDERWIEVRRMLDESQTMVMRQTDVQWRCAVVDHNTTHL